MLTASELSAMRSTLTGSLADTAEIKRRTLVSDGAGGYTESWSTVATVSCRVAPAGRSGDERRIADRLTAIGAWLVTLPATTDIAVADRITVGSRTFEVAGVLARSDEISRRVVCTEAS